MVQIDGSGQVLEYIQKRGKLPIASILKGIPLSRRQIFTYLSRLIKKGLIYKEGVHPKVYYIARAIPKQPKPAPQVPVEPLLIPDHSKKLEYLQQKLTAAVEEQARLAKELSQARHEMYELKNKLNSKELDLKGALAKVNYQESRIQQVVERENQKHQDNQRLRQDIEDLQAKLRETQRQNVLKK